MSLIYPAEWKFPTIEEPGALSEASVAEFLDMAVKIASNNQDVIEVFKKVFAAQTGGSTMRSSDFGWAKSDLFSLMEEASGNAPVFIDTICTSLERLSKDGYTVPGYDYVNKILKNNEINFKIEGKKLTRLNGDALVSKSDPNKESNFDTNGGMQYFIGSEPIGSGGFGTVYRATRKTKIAEFEFALKFLDPSPSTRIMKKQSRDSNERLRQFKYCNINQ